jgi:nuclear pore complex protein Nup133
VLKSALDYRDYNLGVYGIDLPMINPWSSRPAIIDVVLGLFYSSTGAVESSFAPMSASEGTNQEPSTQLPELAALLFVCIQERLDWLGRFASVVRVISYIVLIRSFLV